MFFVYFFYILGDNWNGIMKDTLRDDCDDEADCVRNCCVSAIIAPIFFVIFVLMAQFVLVNVVVAVLMKHLEESHKQIEDDELDMEELEREMIQAQKFEEEQALCMQLDESSSIQKRPLEKVLSLPSDFTYNSSIFENRYNAQRRQTLQFSSNGTSRLSDFNHSAVLAEDRSTSSGKIPEFELGEMKPKTKQKSKKDSIEIEQCNINAIHTPNSSRKFDREISLDERQMIPKAQQTKSIDVKRTSCDQLHSRDCKTTNFNQKTNVKQMEKCANKPLTEKLTTSKDSLVMAADHAKKALYRRSSLKFDYGNTPVTKTSIPLTKSQSVNRSGSCRQLFKQHALDDDADIDENSLLLPVLNKLRPHHVEKNKNAEETSLHYKNNHEKE